MASLKPMEKCWLKYARSIMRPDAQHIAECLATGGASIKPNIDASLRWPGFIGENYVRSSRRVLCVAKIHNPSGWTSKPPNMSSLQTLMTDWLDGKVSDQDFLLDYSSQYAKYMQTWGPWKKAFGRVLTDPRIAIPADEVAYTNIAKCWQDDARVVTLRLCNRVFPISTLVGKIKPHAIIVLAATNTLRDIHFDSHRKNLMNFSGPHFLVSNADLEEMIVWLSGILVRTPPRANQKRRQGT
jgi:hypothetical protein